MYLSYSAVKQKSTSRIAISGLTGTRLQNKWWRWKKRGD